MPVTYTSICLDTSKRRVTNIYGETKTVIIPQKICIYILSRKYDSIGKSEKKH